MTELESAIQRAASGELPVEELLRTLAESEVLVPSDNPSALVPVVVHRDDLSFAVVFTRIGVPFPPAAGRPVVALSGSILIRGLAPGVGVVVNPGAEVGFELPAAAVSAFAAVLRAAGDPVRYFVRFRHDLGQLIPFALLRRRVDGGAAVDEVLRDVDVWGPDRNASVDRAIRFPLDTDLVEVDAARAEQFVRMVEARDYRPFTP